MCMHVHNSVCVRVHARVYSICWTEHSGGSLTEWKKRWFSIISFFGGDAFTLPFPVKK